MKNQYFGDINDYKKYGLLRILANSEDMKLAVCWMLTDADHSTDGKFTRYLGEPGKWRRLDPPLFDSLNQALQQPETRDVRWMNTANLLPGGVFFEPILSDNSPGRRQYFEQFRSFATGHNLVFFDPDNGLEIKSKAVGRKGSSKFLYWDEMLRTFKDGHSILVYQHFQRVERSAFLRTLTSEISSRLGASEVIVLRTANVAFLLVPQPHHLEYLRERANDVERVWEKHIEVAHYAPASVTP